MKNPTRSELARRVERLESDLTKLAAVVFVMRKLVAYTEYVRSTSGWSYSPQTASGAIIGRAKPGYSIASAFSGNVSTRQHPAAAFDVPPITTMYENILRDVEL